MRDDLYIVTLVLFAGDVKKKHSGPGTRQGPNQPSVPRDNPITELILKPLQVPRALQASKLLSLKKTIEILSPLM